MINKNYYPNVDVLRGFAAISVLVYHVIELYQWKAFPTQGVLLWFRIGWLGVDLFFVISGFVIALSAFASIDKLGSTSFRKPFFLRRVSRIVPLHYLTMLIFLVFVMPSFLFEGLFKNLISHLLFVHNMFPTLHGGINGVNWSLGTEMQFYILMLIIAPWLKVAKVWKIALYFLSVTWLWRYGVTSLVHPDKVQGTFRIFVAATQLPGMLDEFLAGILLARLVMSDSVSDFITSVEPSPLKQFVLFLISGLLIYLTWIIFWHYPSYWDRPLMIIFFRTLVAVSCASLVFSFCVLDVKGIFEKFFIPIRYLGTISFGIYLWHLPVILSLQRVQWLQPQKALILTLSITIVFAVISWHLFEKPFMNRHKKIITK